MSFLQNDICDLAPLFLCGINTSRVVCASVQEEDGARWSGGKRFEEGIVCESDRLGIVVWVSQRLDLDIAEDGKVVDCEYG